MRDIVEQWTVGGKTLKIYFDSDAENPRRAFDSLGTMYCWHHRYDLGDRHDIKDPADFRPEEYAICLPLYLYDHSGLRMSTSDFGDRWDSGQVGWIAVTKEKLLAEYGAPSPLTEGVAKHNLISEVQEYDRYLYLSGDVYGYTVTDNASGEVEDSCWGFYGSDFVANGLVDNAPSEFRAAIESKSGGNRTA